MTQQRWLIDHAFRDAPPSERGKRAEMDRYLKLADLAVQAGDIGEAVSVLRTALQTDPARYQDILSRLDRLPLSPPDRRRLQAEFRWNIRALQPGVLPPDDGPRPCWSYRVREVRVHSTTVHQGIGSRERRISYDARDWIYDDAAESWRADSEWLMDVGTEVERIGGPQQSRYRAVIAADGGFLAEGPIPPCHRSQWSGPFDTERERLFVAETLPASQ
ncbi:MAG TPA: hypothetical protein VMW17_04060 [Candidatus Binatia bacterium]|nr:hypothetical protein [Candidatus Binatia bacterium]